MPNQDTWDLPPPVLPLAQTPLSALKLLSWHFGRHAGKVCALKSVGLLWGGFDTVFSQANKIAEVKL